jgi:hypothetical protein
MEAVSGSGKVYLVRRLPDRWGYQRGKAGPIQRAFTERGAAEAFRQEGDRRVWFDERRPVLEALAHPANLQSPFELTSFERPVFLDWLEDVGIPAPPDDLREPLECVEWWEGCRGLSDVQWLRLFEALDQVRFYEVAEVELSADGRRAAPPDYGRVLGGEGRPESREDRPAGGYAPWLDAPEQSDQYDGDDTPF